VLDAAGLGHDAPAPFAHGRTLAHALLEPTRIYVKPLLALHKAGLLKAAAHITGGGLPGNLPRVLPKGVSAVIEAGSWPLPPVFPWLARTGNVAEAEMLRVFNCGLGMVIVVAESDAGPALVALAAGGLDAHRVGHLEPASGETGVIMRGHLPL
jgi:phosphoribosylformylglycinamidine cyclo-ligase